MLEAAEKSHAVLGPSGWSTWGKCPGSVPLSEGIVKTSSEYADEGTAAHTLLEKCLTEEANAEDFLGETIVVGSRSFIVDNEMADAVNSAIDIVKSYMDEGAILQVEQTVPLAQMTGEEGAEGTCDIAIIRENGTALVIMDFKYGKGVMVYASDLVPDEGEKRPNGQLAMYALGWLQKYGMIYEDVTKIAMIVLQPRMEWVDEHVVTLEQLRDFEGVIRDAAGAVELERLEHLQGGADLTLVPGDKQCKFCAAKAICPALKSYVSTSLAKIAEPSKAEHFEDLTLPKQAAAVAVNPDVSNEKLAEFMRAIPLIEEALTAARAEVERRLFAGEEVPGFYLGVGRKGNRAWANEERARKAIVKKGRLTKAQAYKEVLISPAEAEKLLGKDTLTLLLKEGVVTQADGKPSVCREGDKNEPFKIASAVEDFGSIDTPKIITSKATTEGLGLFVEASDGRHVVIPNKLCTGPIVKKTRVGEPYAALLDALGPTEDENAALAALMD